MQLDQTRIAIRERGLLETLDLALHVTREFAGPLIVAALLAVVPLALLNYALIGRLAASGDELEDPGLLFRYVWHATVLVYLEAPLAAALIVAYLGPAVFMERRSLQEVVRDVLRSLGPLVWCQGVVRGVLGAWGLYLLVDPSVSNGFVEGFLIVMLLLWSTALRAFRPYINEIVLLEKNPLWTRRPGAITIGKRSSHLHGPYSGDLLLGWLGAATIATLLVGLALVTAMTAQGVLFDDWPVHLNVDPFALAWNLDPLKLHVVYPACLWAVASFMAVVRFLSYLDLRIRHEGWEVELLLRAEALRLSAQME